VIEMSVALDEQLITLRTDKLLEEFGAGNEVPGAGSAAALMGILAGQLCLTVIKLTREKDEYSDVLLQLGFMERRLEVFEEKLKDSFQRDTEEWAYVIEVRRKRDAALKGSEERRQLAEQARLLTEKSTDILLEISSNCLEVSKEALDIFNVGYQSARGDSSVAAWGALAGAKSALATAYLNLKSFRHERAASIVRSKCDVLLEQLESLQVELDANITKLRTEGQPASKGKPNAEEGARELLPLAARNTSAAHRNDTQTQKSNAVTKEEVVAQSDEEVFDEIFMRKKQGAWFRRIHNFFTLQGLGTFSTNRGFLRYVKQSIDENKYRSAEKLTDDILLKWYKTFDTRQRREGL
jgi:formiminotetrahydrofolate cyclodeaminase